MHISESDFADHVERYLQYQYGEEYVEREYVFEDNLRVDFLVQTPLCRLAIELENDAASIRDGLGQAVDYHRKAPDLRPVILVPKGHVSDTRVEAYSPYVLIREFDVEKKELV
jgi:hypothetical protein